MKKATLLIVCFLAVIATAISFPRYTTKEFTPNKLGTLAQNVASPHGNNHRFAANNCQSCHSPAALQANELSSKGNTRYERVFKML
ncbi:hypothetical protein LX64_01588 [Chitinophaga skermanii]|uniref:Cytochrome c domain-containing protein n=1 Tax=Chitinophaga skermanii TaxID=331697 RepID=A0A327QQD1_9BACT|nr:hypothetical protein [Chitinophaga skermanii]RAJ06461.1 hypothetical protein LX64_01588 [Chitinophaga skermanii]